MTPAEKRPVVLVTGATGIIGPAIVKALSDEGWVVVATDRSESDRHMCENLLGRKLDAEGFISADLTTRANAVSLMDEIERTFGGVSAIVNAATVNFNRPFSEIREDEAETEIAVNFLAPLWLAQIALPSLRAGAGSIVNFSSVRVAAPRRTSLIYSCTKAAVETATQVLAGSLLEEGVRVNAIRVGLVPGNHFLRDAAGTLSPEDAAKMAADILPGHLERARLAVGEACVGLPEEIARWVVILINRKNRFLNGETITLDGGYLRKMPGAPAASSTPDFVADWLKNHHGT